MSPDKQNIAIAEACGWHGNVNELHMRPPNTTSEYCEIPDFLTDLNAMHEAEKVLDYNQMNRYQNIELSGFVRTGTTWICRATAAQRAEAFLRTTGKWEAAK